MLLWSYMGGCLLGGGGDGHSVVADGMKARYALCILISCFANGV